MQSPSKKRCRVTCSRGMREKTALRPLLPFLVDHRPRGIRFPPWTQRAPDHRPSTLLVPRAPPSAMENSRTAKIQSTNARALGISSLEPSKKTFQKTYTYIYTFIRSRNRISLASITISNFLETLARFSPSFPISGDPTRAFGTRSGLKVKCRIVAGQTVALVNGRLRGEKVEGGSPSCIHLV